MDPYLVMTIEVIITAILSVEVYKLRCLSKSGAIASLVVGTVLAIFGSIGEFFVMTFFSIMGFFATLKDIDKKAEMGLQEGNYGERDWRNITGVALPSCLIVVFNYFSPMEHNLYVIAFLTTVTVAAADTIASEIGVKDPKAYLITTLKPTIPGVNGGVSVLGTVSSTIVAFIVAVIGWIALTASISWLLLIPFAFGVVGNFLDSVFGALLENKGYINKYVNNSMSEIIAAALAAGFYLII